MAARPSSITSGLISKIIWFSDRVLRGSAEYRKAQSQPEGARLTARMLTPGYRATPNAIDVDVPADVLDRLFQRTQDQWTKLGAEEPHWSVITDNAFKRSELTPESERYFYETGRDTAELLDIFEARTRTRLSRGVCLDLGCGVGRITRALADRFERVIGVDISPGNLEVCRAYCEAQGVANVELVQLRSVADLEDLPEFDVLFSVIVLQHNSPPLQQAMLKTLLNKVRPGGGCLFQTCTNLIGYTFDAGSYLELPDQEMELHALPQYAVLRAIRESGLQVQEVALDGWVDEYGSNTFFARR